MIQSIRYKSSLHSTKFFPGSEFQFSLVLGFYFYFELYILYYCKIGSVNFKINRKIMNVSSRLRPGLSKMHELLVGSSLLQTMGVFTSTCSFNATSKSLTKSSEGLNLSFKKNSSSWSISWLHSRRSVVEFRVLRADFGVGIQIQDGGISRLSGSRLVRLKCH